MDLGAFIPASAKPVPHQITSFQLDDIVQVGLLYIVYDYLVVPTVYLDFMQLESVMWFFSIYNELVNEMKIIMIASVPINVYNQKLTAMLVTASDRAV